MVEQYAGIDDWVIAMAEDKTEPAIPSETTQPADVQLPGPSGAPFEIAILALQNLTLFPETVVPLGVGRPRSIAAVEAALSTPEKLLACITVHPHKTSETDATSQDL